MKVVRKLSVKLVRQASMKLVRQKMDTSILLGWPKILKDKSTGNQLNTFILT